MKQKIILDTNVLVSACLTTGFIFQLVLKIIGNKNIVLCTSDKVIAEYTEVLSRSKFHKVKGFRTTADTILTIMQEVGIPFLPKQSVQLLTDADDDKFLELALEAKADYLITGNTNDFTLTEFAGCKIVSPRTYFDLFLADDDGLS